MHLFREGTIEHNRLMRKIIYSLILIVLVCATGCMSLFFYPHKQLFPNPVAQQFSPEDVRFRSSDGVNLHGWFFRSIHPARGTVLVLHGNAQNLSTHVNGVLWMIREGYNVFIFDYRGYGLSEGEPSIQGVHRDAEAALATLLAMPDANKDKIVIFGQSIGAAIAVYTTTHTPHKDRIAALVIDSAFSSYRLIAREKMNAIWLTWPFQYPFSLFFNDDFSAIRFIRQVSPVPVLIINGKQDQVVPWQHGQQLFDAALEPKEFWKPEEVGHIRFLADDESREALSAYLKKISGKKE